MFLTPKLFNFNVYESFQWPVRNPAQEFPVSQRFNSSNLLSQSLLLPNLKKHQPKIVKNAFEPMLNKPKTVTIVKYGNEKPYRTISILLNRRTIQTLDQLLSDITEAFGYQKYRHERIRRLFTLKGRQINGMHDFFRDDDIFVGVTGQNDISVNDFQEIVQEIQNDPSYRRHFVKANHETSPTSDVADASVSSLPPITIDVRRTHGKRDMMVTEGSELEDNSPQNYSHRLGPTKISENSFEENSAIIEMSSRKTRKIIKHQPILPPEQQRERERQRFREEEERRKKIMGKKEHANVKITPKFVPLATEAINNPPILSNNIKAVVSTPREIPLKKRSNVLYPSSSIVTDKYDFGKKMGDGNFAIVRRSRANENGREYAIKVIDKSKMKGKEYMLDNEINIMYICHHSNIVRLYEDYETNDEIYLVMELIKGGDLFDYITKHRRFDEPLACNIIRDIGEALFYLHSKNIVHRDLKPENLLVLQRRDGRIQIKLTDFGLAMFVTGTIKTVCGTPTYVAPEILAETGYGLEVDCWAVGVILYILLCGYPPFKSSERNQEVLFQMIQKGKYSYDPEYWNSVSSNAKDLIDHLLVTDRCKRMTSLEILLHPWIITVGQSKSIRNIEDVKTNLRTAYESKMKEYAKEKISDDDS